MERFEKLHLTMLNKSKKWQPSLVSWGDVYFEKCPPARTDGGKGQPCQARERVR